MCDPVTIAATAAVVGAGTGTAVGVGVAGIAGAGALVGTAVGATIAGVGFALAGQQQQSQDQQAAFAMEEATLRNQQAVIAQDVGIERDNERLRQQLISEEGRKRRGDIRVAQANLGQLVDVGSAADVTKELAGEVAFKKLISKRQSDLRERNFQIQSGNIGADIRSVRLKAKSNRKALPFTQAKTILGGAEKLATRFKFGDNNSLQFRV